MKSKLSFLFAALALQGLSASASANLVANGSFEADFQSPNSWSSPQNLTSWTGGNAGIELRNNVSGAAQHGSNFVELDTYSNSSMSQNINIATDGWYALSFWFSARPGTGATNDLSYNFGALSGNLLNGVGNSNSSHNWQQFMQTQFLAAGTYLLSFAADGPSDAYGGSLDNISVSAVPEAETYAMLLAGLGLMGTVARRRKHAK